jgi:hypothetical protein
MTLPLTADVQFRKGPCATYGLIRFTNNSYQLVQGGLNGRKVKLVRPRLVSRTMLRATEADRRCARRLGCESDSSRTIGLDPAFGQVC